ncbi:hypothetical protein G3N95_24155 [Paraburkholderia sp. Tr-20389]|uniref:hypothetical protein n=1 Tax=Paraburkholderia sp. Tr-20389 TaxID=2703903 RepID=UPI001981B042|nr:hypothetical protein [Paraburkholderia sp. Tr-20389]MBN3756057.1 hypothetical protein [Paraburkholderia sp. Tr-20389]
MKVANISTFRRRTRKPDQSSEPAEVDFSLAIQKLRIRAKHSRRSLSVVAFIVTMVITFSASFIFLRLTHASASEEMEKAQLNMEAAMYRYQEKEEPLSPRLLILPRIESLLHQIYPEPILKYDRAGKIVSNTPSPLLPPQDANARVNDINQLVTIYEKLQKASPADKRETSEKDYAPVIATIAFSAGAVAFVILAIQISVMFMRYYAQLAELYEAQAVALEASGGNVQTAIKFMESFSPNTIQLGRAPITLFEKSLEAVTEVAKSKAK